MFYSIISRIQMITELYYMKHRKNIVCPSITPSRITFYDLTIVLDGELTYIVNGKKCRITANEAICVPPGTLRARNGSEHVVSYISFNFACDEPLDFPLTLTGILDRKVIALISACDAVGDVFDSTQKKIAASITNAVILSLESIIESRTFSRITRDALLYIQKNYKQRLTMRQICDDVSYSAPHLSRIFKKETGKSIMDYVIMLKIETAKSLIVEKNLSLVEIAAQVGYDDYNYFTHLFKKRVGSSPLNYIKQLDKNPESL